MEEVPPRDQRRHLLSIWTVSMWRQPWTPKSSDSTAGVAPAAVAETDAAETDDFVAVAAAAADPYGDVGCCCCYTPPSYRAIEGPAAAPDDDAAAA